MMIGQKVLCGHYGVPPGDLTSGLVITSILSGSGRIRSVPVPSGLVHAAGLVNV